MTELAEKGGGNPPSDNKQKPASQQGGGPSREASGNKNEGKKQQQGQGDAKSNPQKQKASSQANAGPSIQKQPTRQTVAPFESGPPVGSAWGPKQQLNVPTGPVNPGPPISSAWGPKAQFDPQAQFDTVQASAIGSAWGSKPQFEPVLTQQPKKKESDQGQRSAKKQPIEPNLGGKRQAEQLKNVTAKSLDLENLSLSTSSATSTQSSPRAPIPTSALMPVAPNKGCGTRGKPIMVDVNFLPLIIGGLLPTVYQYDVTIEPNLPKRLLPKIFEEYRKKNFKNVFIAFDGQKIAVSPQHLTLTEKMEKKTNVIDEHGKDRVYMVSIKEARDCRIDFSSLRNYTNMRQFDAPLRAIQMLEIVLKSAFFDKNGVQAGRSFYMVPSKREDLGDNYELWTGLYQSTVLGSQPYLNVDIAHKAFPTEMSVIDILSRIRGVDLNRDLDFRAKNELQSHLKGLMITYGMPGHGASRRSYKFLGFNDNATKYKFRSDQDQQEHTILSYFRSRGANIRYASLPTLKLGNSIKNITVPMEFCTIAGYQAVNKKCTETQTRNMIKIAATSTDERRRKIMDMLQKIAHNQSPTLKQFGVSVGSEFEKVPARILVAPKLLYSDQRTIMPAKGQWRIDNTKFLRPKELTKYAILIMDRYVRDNNGRDFASVISRTGRSLGMNIESKCDIYLLETNGRDFQRDLHKKMSDMIGENIELLFCIIPDRGDIYGKVKQCAELKCGILTQCIRANTLLKKGSDPSTITNILLKVNAKLNGTNHKFAEAPQIMKQPFMIIGADVTHPSPGQEDIPSVVGVVSSHDPTGFLYNKCWRLQDPKQEMISDFGEILKEHLEFFEKRNKMLPKVILYFRDGVSEGQFQQVLTVELNAMYAGCQQYREGYKPNITFIVVQKRHHTRFFPPKNSDLGRDDRKNNNVPPGTIVDTKITHPNESQFYLVSHQSIQGVARPTKYCLLRDDSNISIDDLQALTYNLCHFFVRCTRSVSYPAPTYYAHLAASRGRVYIEGCNINMAKLDMEFRNRTVKEPINKGHPMYFV